MSEVKDDDPSKRPHDAEDEKRLTKSPQREGDSVSEIPSEIAEMPPEVRASYQSFMASVQSGMGMPLSQFFNKFTDAHIDKFLDYVQRDDDHDHEIRKSNRVYYLVYFIISILTFAGFVVYLLPKDKDLLVQLITFLVLVAGGIGAGYGIKSRDKD